MTLAGSELLCTATKIACVMVVWRLVESAARANRNSRVLGRLARMYAVCKAEAAAVLTARTKSKRMRTGWRRQKSLAAREGAGEDGGQKGGHLHGKRPPTHAASRIHTHPKLRSALPSNGEGLHGSANRAAAATHSAMLSPVLLPAKALALHSRLLCLSAR